MVVVRAPKEKSMHMPEFYKIFSTEIDLSDNNITVSDASKFRETREKLISMILPYIVDRQLSKTL